MTTLIPGEKIKLEYMGINIELSDAFKKKIERMEGTLADLCHELARLSDRISELEKKP